jgi:hypothetical protein
MQNSFGKKNIHFDVEYNNIRQFLRSKLPVATNSPTNTPQDSSEKSPISVHGR